MAATMENIYRLLKLFRPTQKIATCLHRNHARVQILRNRWTTTQKYSLVKLLPRPAAISSIATASAVGWFAKQEDLQAGELKQKTVVEQADELYDAGQTINLYNFLKENYDENDDETLWRLARACHDMSKMSKSKIKSQEYMYAGLDLVKKALKLNDNNYASHKWYAILLDKTAEFDGTKARLENSVLVRDEFLRAVELNPKDATSMYSLGHWCYLFAEMPWHKRKIASAIFTTPPTSTFEEALKYLEMAEKVDPDFYIWNHVYLGKTYLRLGDLENAKKYLIKAREFPREITLLDEHEAQIEAFRVLLANKMIDPKEEQKEALVKERELQKKERDLQKKELEAQENSSK